MPSVVCKCMYGAGEGKGRRKFERRAFVVAMTLQKRGHRAAAQSPPPTLKLRVNGVCPLFILPSPPCLPLGQISKAVRLSRPGLPPCHILLALVENGLALEEGSGIQTVHCSWVRERCFLPPGGRIQNKLSILANCFCAWWWYLCLLQAL